MTKRLLSMISYDLKKEHKNTSKNGKSKYMSAFNMVLIKVLIIEIKFITFILSLH